MNSTQQASLQVQYLCFLFSGLACSVGEMFLPRMQRVSEVCYSANNTVVVAVCCVIFIVVAKTRDVVIFSPSYNERNKDKPQCTGI